MEQPGDSKGQNPGDSAPPQGAQNPVEPADSGAAGSESPAGEEQVGGGSIPPETPDQKKLAAAALAATAPTPPAWAQWGQMVLALLALMGAFGIAGILVIGGPPAPEAATVKLTETKKNEAGETTETTTRTGVVGAQVTGTEASSPVVEETPEITAKEKEEKEEEDGVETPSGGEESKPAEETETAEEGESLANLSKQGPWAFAIVALLVGAFIATGKSLNVGGKAGGA
jgi:hypothetical protein